MCACERTQKQLCTATFSSFRCLYMNVCVLVRVIFCLVCAIFQCVSSSFIRWVLFIVGRVCVYVFMRFAAFRLVCCVVGFGACVMFVPNAVNHSSTSPIPYVLAHNFIKRLQELAFPLLNLFVRSVSFSLPFVRLLFIFFLNLFFVYL